jgi:nucleoside-diphosphate-sugar epimerase
MTKPVKRQTNYEPLHNKKVLVIGASSFIGTHLVLKLVEHGAIVHATYLSKKPDFCSQVTVEYLDITDPIAVKNRLKHFGPDYVFNMAAYVNGSRSIEMVLPTIKANLGGNINLLLAATEYPVKRIVLLGSMDEYQELANEISPASPYAASKIASSAYAKMFHSLYQLPIVIAKVFMVYGPNQRDTQKLIPYTITSLLRGEKPKFSAGTRMVDWVYISDVIDGLLKLMLVPGLEGESVSIGTGKLVSVRAVISRIFKALNIQEPPNFGFIPERPMETMVAAEIEHTKEKIGWEPSIEINAGIEKTVKWYQECFQSTPSC